MSFASFLENKENLVSGPGINLLKTTFHDMFERGAPVVDDFTGFNKIDFGAYKAIVGDPNFHNDAIPVATASRMLAILSRYKNTQISNYEDIKKAVEDDIKSSLKMDDHQEIVIHTDAARVYNKIKVYVPGGISKSKKLMAKISDMIVEKKKLVKVRDNYGSMKYPIFRFFNTDRNQLNTYYIHPEVIDDVIKLISEEMGLSVKVSGSPVSSEEKAPASEKKQLVVVGMQDTRFGKKIAIQLNVSFDQSKSILDSAKASNLVPRGYSYDGSTRPPKFLIAADSKDLYDAVKGKLTDGGIDVADLEKFVDENKLFSGEGQKEISFEKKSEQIKTTKPVVSFSDRRGGVDDVMIISVPYREASQDQKAFLKELIQYTFPSYRWDDKNFSYVVSGNFKQYATFGQILKKFGYHVEDLRAILDSKIKNGGVKRTDYEGKVDQDFKDKIESRLPESKFELYKEQKDGISFLYGRNHAILGDATGVGKCITLDSLLITNKGMIKIGDLAPKNIELTPDRFYPVDEDIKVWTGKKWAKIKSYYYSGFKPSIKVSTRLGYGVTGSFVHPLITRRSGESYSQLKDITKDNYLAIVRDSNITFPSEEPSLPTMRGKHFGPATKVYKTPDKLSPALSALLGYIVSEGWTANKYRINIFQDKNLNPEVHEHIRFLAKDIFGWEGNKNNSLADFEINITSVYIRSYLELLGINFDLSASKIVPWPILLGTKESVVGFLRSFFDSEGSVCRGNIEISSASEKMLKEIQILLLRLGIISSRKPKIVKNRNHIYWRVTICGSEARKFQEIIGFVTKRKQKALDWVVNKKINPNLDVVPYCLEQIENLRKEILHAVSKKGSNELRRDSGLKQFGKSFQSTLCNIRNKNRNPTYHFIKNILEISKKLSLQETCAYKAIEKIHNNHFFYDPVVCLEETEEELADIEVDDDEHCFVSNGLINHNTVQMISAAELRMQDVGPNSKTLVITLKAVQNQWIEEIKNVVGEDADISKDGTSPRRWTILYYDNFSSGKNLQNVIDSTKNANYSIVIFDELHKLKHQTAKRSQNIEEATKNISYKWGASATISANRPSDVKNQLKIVGHPLGDIQDGKFKRDFSGMVAGGYRGAYTEGSFEDRIRAAEKLNKWLNLSGVYVRRTKEDLREMPNLSIDTASTDIKEEDFHKSLKEKLKGYKDPDLAISELIASREVLANMKVDYTVNKAFETIKSNLDNPANNYAASKVVIFTNFVKAGSEIFEKLSKKLQDIDPKFKVITYLSLTKKTERNKVKEVFTNDPNAKALVMSMKMGGTGISFPNASQNMIINDFDWTPESAEQSEGRIYRINTDHPVNITYTIAKGLDTELFVIVQKKRKLAELIQRYRKEYQEKEVDEETIQKIIDAQKKMQEIDSEINKLIANAAAKAMDENVSFKDYLDLFFTTG